MPTSKDPLGSSDVSKELEYQHQKVGASRIMLPKRKKSQKNGVPGDAILSKSKKILGFLWYVFL
jgi:hypothetical protein